MAEAILLRFAREELVYLLRALKIATLTGLGSNPMGDLDDDHQALALAVADRTLRARGVVHWDTSQERSIDPLVAGLLRDCARPDYSLAVEIRREEQPLVQYRYAFTGHVVIEQSLPEPGVHQWVALATRGDVLDRLNKLVGVSPTLAGIGQPSQISLKLLMKVRAMAPTDPNEARRLLGASFPRETASSLVSALATPGAVHYLALWKGAPDQPTEHPPIANLTVLMGQQHLFYLLQQPGEIGPVEVAPTTAAHIPQQIEHLLTPALDALQTT